ncbi:hypothetical protein LA345_12925 [Burkholderia vietnamiensis]|uniref:Uncharacterized protein n=1 Tax=Burkholderia vietnamiensis (strain G4 / LMG 22486) TaxID=269482 RepID=A4JFK2_BURVG|nr:hypothetical protein Bcep1808_2053 [Burkholderia vietnamiensis G4]MCB4344815.1 hypothetical protein [Burkholderia vietnamiensis]
MTSTNDSTPTSFAHGRESGESAARASMQRDGTEHLLPEQLELPIVKNPIKAWDEMMALRGSKDVQPLSSEQVQRLHEQVTLAKAIAHISRAETRKAEEQLKKQMAAAAGNLVTKTVRPAEGANDPLPTRGSAPTKDAAMDALDKTAAAIAELRRNTTSDDEAESQEPENPYADYEFVDEQEKDRGDRIVARAQAKLESGAIPVSWNEAIIHFHAETVDQAGEDPDAAGEGDGQYRLVVEMVWIDAASAHGPEAERGLRLEIESEELCPILPRDAGATAAGEGGAWDADGVASNEQFFAWSETLTTDGRRASAALFDRLNALRDVRVFAYQPFKAINRLLRALHDASRTDPGSADAEQAYDEFLARLRLNAMDHPIQSIEDYLRVARFRLAADYLLIKTPAEAFAFAQCEPQRFAEMGCAYPHALAELYLLRRLIRDLEETALRALNGAA